MPGHAHVGYVVRRQGYRGEELYYEVMCQSNPTLVPYGGSIEHQSRLGYISWTSADCGDLPGVPQTLPMRASGPAY
jgi:hypothetical protein